MHPRKVKFTPQHPPRLQVQGDTSGFGGGKSSDCPTWAKTPVWAFSRLQGTWPCSKGRAGAVGSAFPWLCIPKVNWLPLPILRTEGGGKGPLLSNCKAIKRLIK